MFRSLAWFLKSPRAPWSYFLVSWGGCSMLKVSQFWATEIMGERKNHLPRWEARSQLFVGEKEFQIWIFWVFCNLFGSRTMHQWEIYQVQIFRFVRVKSFLGAQFWTSLHEVGDFYLRNGWRFHEGCADERQYLCWVLDWCHSFFIVISLHMVFRWGQSLGTHLGLRRKKIQMISNWPLQAHSCHYVFSCYMFQLLCLSVISRCVFGLLYVFWLLCILVNISQITGSSTEPFLYSPTFVVNLP